MKRVQNFLLAYKAFSGANFTVNYTLPQTNINRNFSVVNTVVAPATATAINENQDNDVISNTAQNAGGKRRKKRSTTYSRMNDILRKFFLYIRSFLDMLSFKRNVSNDKLFVENTNSSKEKIEIK